MIPKFVSMAGEEWVGGKARTVAQEALGAWIVQGLLGHFNCFGFCSRGMGNQ